MVKKKSIALEAEVLWILTSSFTICFWYSTTFLVFSGS